MASRVFSRRLLLGRSPATSSVSNSTSGAVLLQPRHFSAKADAVEPNNHDAAAAKPEQLSPMLAVFEDLIHGMIVQRCEPEWLPFVPGSSFWVPPRPKSGTFIKEIEKLSVGVNRALSDEETMSLTTMRGWPSSSFFLQGNEEAAKKSDARDEDASVTAADASSSENKIY